jgi:hypothetical protein
LGQYTRFENYVPEIYTGGGIAGESFSGGSYSNEKITDDNSSGGSNI